jgi:hypothetical protein
MPVPKYLHNAWLKTATAEQKEILEHEQQKRRKETTLQMLEAKEQIIQAQQAIKAGKRKL